MKDTKPIQSNVKCERCGKVIPISNSDVGYATDYVWRNGKNLCKECNKKEQ